jgi:peptide/nickel transport system substrate-binding protein
MVKPSYVDEKELKSCENKPQKTRRRFLQGSLIAGVVSLAGCSGNSGDDDDESADTEGLTEVHSAELWGPTADGGINHRTSKLANEAIQDELPFDFEWVPQRNSRNVELAFFQQDFDSYYSQLTLRPERVDPHNMLVGNLRQANNTCGAFNISGYSDDDAEEMFTESVETVNEDDRQEIIKDIQNQLATLEDPVEFSTERSLVFPIFPQIWNSNKFTNVTETAGLGIRNIWTFNEIEPLTDNRDLVVALTAESANINPMISEAGNRSAVRNVFESLTRMGPDGLPREWLATNWEVSDDNRTFTFTIRDGVEFHDGEPLTAEDVVFAYNYQRENSPFMGSSIASISNIELVDDVTARFELEDPFAPIFTQVFNRVPIIPKHIWEDVPDRVDATEAFEWAAYEEDGMIGSGHMLFDGWDIGSEIRLEQNPDHWRPANVDSIIFRVVLDDEAMLGSLENGDIDMVWDIGGAAPSTVLEAAEGADNLSSKEVLGVGSRTHIVNAKTGPFSFPEVRAAIECVIPKKTIVNEVWDGLAREGQGQISPAVEFWHSEEQKKWGQSYQGREGAIEILEDRGFVVEDDAVYYPEGEAPPEKLDGYGCES